MVKAVILFILARFAEIGGAICLVGVSVMLWARGIRTGVIQ